MEEKKSYYAIIPANVRYDKNITGNAKLLYGEITALCNEKGYCWATNNYFAELYQVSHNTITNWLKDLKKAGYIEIYIKYKKDSKEVEARYIKILVEGTQNNLDTSPKKLGEGTPKNCEDNNTFNNTYNINNNDNNYVCIEELKFNGKTVDEIQEKMNNLRKY